MLLGWKRRPFRFEADEVLCNVQVLCNTKSLILFNLLFLTQDRILFALISCQRYTLLQATDPPQLSNRIAQAPCVQTFWKKVLVNASFLATWELEILTFGKASTKVVASRDAVPWWQTIPWLFNATTAVLFNVSYTIWRLADRNLGCMMVGSTLLGTYACGENLSSIGI